MMKDRNVMVLGMARSGIAAAELLLLRGAKVTVCDMKTEDKFEGALDGIRAAGAAFMLGEAHPEERLAGFDALVVDPCIPADWDGFEMTRRWRGAEYRIRVDNPNHVEKGVVSLTVDGIRTDRIPVFSEGIHTVAAVMGRKEAEK